MQTRKRTLLQQQFQFVVPILMLITMLGNINAAAVGPAQTAVAKASPPEEYTCENGVCQRGCPLKSFLQIGDHIFKSPDHPRHFASTHVRVKRVFDPLSFIFGGLFYKYIVAWLIPSLIINDVCKNYMIDDLMIDCVKMTILKRRPSCKLPKPIRNSALFTNDVIRIAMDHISDNARNLIKNRFAKFADAVRGLPQLKQDFGGESRVSLELLQEAGLISLEPEMIPKPFEQEYEELMKAEEREHGHEAREMEKKLSIGEHVGNFVNFLQGKTPDQVYEEELRKAIENELNAMEAREIAGRLAEYEHELDAQYEIKQAERAKMYTELMDNYKAKLAKEKEQKKRERESELYRELAERRHKEEQEMRQREEEAEKLMEKSGAENQMALKDVKNDGINYQVLARMIDDEDGDFGWGMPRKSLQAAKPNGLASNHRRRKRFFLETAAGVVLTFIAYNFVRRIALRVAVKNVNIWAYIKNCVKATKEKEGWGISCKLPKRFEEEQKFLRDALKVLLEELTSEGIGRIRLRYALFKRRFPMPITNGKPMAEHEDLSKFLEMIFKGINIRQTFLAQMNAPLNTEEENEMERLIAENPDVVEE